MNSGDQLQASYWETRYKHQQTGWDVGYPVPALTHYFNQLNHKEISILIPGGGNGYEAAYLYQQGFKHVYLLDFASPPLLSFQHRHPDFPSNQLIQEDFFSHQTTYDLIIEHTFFCALPPAQRKNYIIHMHRLLKPSGKLVGLLFNDNSMIDGPPFGGDQTLHQPLFESYFNIKHFEPCTNSIAPRKDRELFIHVSPKPVHE